MFPHDWREDVAWLQVAQPQAIAHIAAWHSMADSNETCQQAHLGLAAAWTHHCASGFAALAVTACLH